MGVLARGWWHTGLFDPHGSGRTPCGARARLRQSPRPYRFRAAPARPEGARRARPSGGVPRRGRIRRVRARPSPGARFRFGAPASAVPVGGVRAARVGAGWARETKAFGLPALSRFRAPSRSQTACPLATRVYPGRGRGSRPGAREAFSLFARRGGRAEAEGSGLPAACATPGPWRRWGVNVRPGDSRSRPLQPCQRPLAERGWPVSMAGDAVGGTPRRHERRAMSVREPVAVVAAVARDTFR